MKNKTTLNYFEKIKDALPNEQYENVENTILAATSAELEAFWRIILAGYPTSFAISNYKNLHEYMKNKNINYNEALGNIYEVYPGLEAGICIDYPEWFELN